jgi:hypothetical protein
MLILLVALCVVLQVSFLPALRPFGVVPNIMLPLVALMGLEGTVSMAAVAALVGGLAVDLASGANFGLWTGVLMLAALVAGQINRAGVELVGPAAAAIVAGGTLVMSLVLILGFAGLAVRLNLGVLAVRFLTELVLNLIIIVVLRPVVRSLAGGSPAEMQMR